MKYNQWNTKDVIGNTIHLVKLQNKLTPGCGGVSFLVRALIVVSLLMWGSITEIWTEVAQKDGHEIRIRKPTERQIRAKGRKTKE